MDDIFDKEKEVVIEAETLLDEKKFNSIEDEACYRELLDSYKRLLKQMRTVVRMSDIMQSKLNSLSSELEKLSQIDGMTGLYNRRYFNEIYQKEWNKALAAETSMGVLMIDIDHFKKYNDTYGHLAGDICLQKIAGAIDQAIKDINAFAGRFGGEEFIVLLPDFNSVQCADAAKNIMKNIADLKIPSAGRICSECVSVSIGIGIMVPIEDVRPDTVINLADQALYRAKDDGRNCVRL